MECAQGTALIGRSKGSSDANRLADATTRCQDTHHPEPQPKCRARPLLAETKDAFLASEGLGRLDPGVRAEQNQVFSENARVCAHWQPLQLCAHFRTVLCLVRAALQLLLTLTTLRGRWALGSGREEPRNPPQFLTLWMKQSRLP